MRGAYSDPLSRILSSDRVVCHPRAQLRTILLHRAKEQSKVLFRNRPLLLLLAKIVVFTD